MQKLNNQAEKFNLNNSVTYLNGAYMSPQLESVSKAGFNALSLKEDPSGIGVDDFYTNSDSIREEFSRLINAKASKRIALIPSVSYGMANVAKNIKVAGRKIILVGEQFPSNVYPWMRLAEEQGGEVIIINAPESNENRGENWNAEILKAIDSSTALVALSHVHWADGTIFELSEIRRRTKEVGSLLVIDGTQSVGAMPFNVEELKPDALICAGYKWLLGPYGLGVAYYGEAFDNGTPIEENWINRLNSEDFTKLVDYEERYQSGALRYEVGEHSNFILVPMLLRALRQLNEWTPERIQQYCEDLVDPVIPRLIASGFWLESKEYRANHLFGIRHKSIPIEVIKKELEAAGIFVSYRGTSVRISPNVYNNAEQMELFANKLTSIQAHA